MQAKISRLSGASYHDWDQLKKDIRHEGFEVIAGGDTYFTRWFIAQGALNGDYGSHSGGDSNGRQTHERKTPSPSAQPKKSTFVICRGVMWRAAELNSLRVWRQISQSWPVPFMPEHLSSQAAGGVVQCHKGMGDMALELSRAIEPHLAKIKGVQATLALLISMTLQEFSHACVHNFRDRAQGRYMFVGLSCIATNLRCLVNSSSKGRCLALVCHKTGSDHSRP
jgi:hypothetical protein